MPYAVLLLALLSGTTAAIKPAKEYFDICHTSDPNFNECVRKSLIKIQPLIIEGIPDFKIAPFDPLIIPKLELGDGSGNFQLHQILHNLTIHGMKNYKLTDLSFDVDNWVFNFTLFHPRLEMKANYELDGQILILQVKGNGVVTFNFTDVTTKSFITLEDFEKGGKTYVRIKDYKLRIEPGHASSYFTNLFNGDKALGESTNKFLNANWEDAFYTYRELPEKAFSEFLKSVSNRVYSLFPKDELFPK